VNEPDPRASVGEVAAALRECLREFPRLVRRDDDGPTISSLAPHDRDRLAWAFEEPQHGLQEALVSGSCTGGFILELAACQVQRALDVSHVIAAVSGLERGEASVFGLKPPSTYRREPLKGLWHAHFFAPRFIARNLCNADLEMAIATAMRVHTGLFHDKGIGEIIGPAVFLALADRARKNKLTGECIIYERQGGKNRYLTLRFHDEADSTVRARLDHYALWGAEVFGAQTQDLRIG
jgi:hypothetical protein